MAVEFYIAKMSDHMESAQILKWLVKEGDRVEQYQIILELMTDKVTAEVEAPATGLIKGIRPGAVDGAEVPVVKSSATSPRRARACLRCRRCRDMKRLTKDERS